MSIIGQNSILNQYVPTFVISGIINNQILAYNSITKAFVNVDPSILSGIQTLGQISNVSPSVNNISLLQDGQSLTYSSSTGLWQNSFIDYSKILNAPNTTGTNTGDQTITLTGDVIGTGTTTFGVTLANVNSNVGTFGSSSTIPVISVDSKGRIISIVNTSATSANEQVIFRYSPGSSGNFTSSDVIFSQTSGITVSFTDPVNCIVSFSFTNKSILPKSIILYSQNYTSNRFFLKDLTSIPSSYIQATGSADTPDILSGITANNVMSLQLRMQDTGAYAGVNQRAFLIIIFGF